ncbi:MAG: hypothetical protein LT106_18855 [Burkholderiaceae bacterium]|nr:hypothetical protein [Burkholderiaceae bacterium]
MRDRGCGRPEHRPLGLGALQGRHDGWRGQPLADRPDEIRDLAVQFVQAGLANARSISFRRGKLRRHFREPALQPRHRISAGEILAHHREQALVGCLARRDDAGADARAAVLSRHAPVVPGARRRHGTAAHAAAQQPTEQRAARRALPCAAADPPRRSHPIARRLP